MIASLFLSAALSMPGAESFATAKAPATQSLSAQRGKPVSVAPGFEMTFQELTKGSHGGAYTVRMDYRVQGVLETGVVQDVSEGSNGSLCWNRAPYRFCIESMDYNAALQLAVTRTP